MLSAPKCIVFYPFNGSLQKLELPVDDRTTVSSIISETMSLLRENNPSLKVKRETQFSLYACRKNGRKCSDLPSFEEKTKIGMTGVKHFLMSSPELEARQQKKKSDIYSASTRSIQSSMMETKNNQKEVKPSKNEGCFCFSRQ